MGWEEVGLVLWVGGFVIWFWAMGTGLEEGLEGGLERRSVVVSGEVLRGESDPCVGDPGSRKKKKKKKEKK